MLTYSRACVLGCATGRKQASGPQLLQPEDLSLLTQGALRRRPAAAADQKARVALFFTQAAPTTCIIRREFSREKDK